MKLSIVTTLYKSELYIKEFYKRATVAAEKLVGQDYEIIMVNDGSPDASLGHAVNLAKNDSHILVIDLSRNFGHHKAMMTGLAHAAGEVVFLIDSDLEEDPEWLLSFSTQMQGAGCDVVYGVQQRRKGGYFEQMSGKWFYWVFNLLTRIKLVPNMSTVRLMTHRYVVSLLQHQEREIFIPGLWQITGFEQQIQLIKKHSTSETTYTWRHKISLLMNAVTSFSNTPLIAIFYIGIIILCFSGGYTGFLIFNRLFFHKILTGWTSVMVSIWLLSGLIISFIGIIGIYLSKMFLEIKQRPYTIIRQIYNGNPEHANILNKAYDTSIVDHKTEPVM